MNRLRRPEAAHVTYGMPESSFKFHNLLQQGLAANGARVTSVVGRAVTPAMHQGLVWKSRQDRVSADQLVEHVGFLNLPVARQAWVSLQVLLYALRWRRSTRGADHRFVIVDAAYVTAVPAVLMACAGRSVMRIALFADIYAYMADVSDASRPRTRIRSLLASAMRWLYARMHGFILLTEEMNSVVNPGHLPSMVMEGVADPGLEVSRHSEPSDPVIVYAGAIREIYGLGALVTGFAAWENSRARLEIYGDGDFMGHVREAGSADSRIVLHGTVPIAEVVNAELNASLLVNPRPTDGEFTRYSFPSKVMEYMSTGTPVLTTRLPGIPDEYIDLVFTIDRPGPDGITEALERVFGMPAERRTEMGIAARTFVLTGKTSLAQARRVLDFAAGIA